MKKIKKFLIYLGYWLVQCTWGIIMTLIGAIAALVLLISGHKPEKVGPNILFTVGKNWGGMSLGPFIFCSTSATRKTRLHEYGHSLQNLVYGPLMPFIVCIPSAVRYWLRKNSTRLKKSLFNLFFLLGSLLITTGLACLTGCLLHWHWMTIGIEVLRIYLTLVSIWLTLIEIPRYDKKDVEYNSIWFEKQATEWGTNIYKKKED